MGSARVLPGSGHPAPERLFTLCASHSEAATVLRAFFPLSRWQASLRRRRSRARRGEIWHAALCLQRGHDSRSLPTARFGAGADRSPDLLRGQSELESRHSELARRAGAGFDIVSGGELFRVLAAGGDPAKCTFAGVGKSRRKSNMRSISASSASTSRAKRNWPTSIGSPGTKNLRAPIALRVNPDVDRRHARLRLDRPRENKFGIALDRMAAVYERAATMPNIAIRGVQMHIGSQITEAAPFAEAITKVTPIVRDLKSRDRNQVLQRRRRHWELFTNRRLPADQAIGGTTDASGEIFRFQHPRLRRRHPASVARIGLAHPARAGPFARRQCRRPPDPRALHQASRARRNS